MTEDIIRVKSNDPDAKEILHWMGNMTELDALEELLYIWWELTPTRRNWQRELAAKSWTQFDYHGCDTCIVHKINTRHYQVIF